MPVPDVELVSSWEEVDEAALSIKNGLQKAQLAAGVRASLDKADDAVQVGQQRAATDWDTEEAGINENGKIVTRPSMSDEAKYSLLSLLSDVAYATPNGAAKLADLEDKLFPTRHLSSITAAYDQDRPIHPDDPMQYIKYDLVVTANYSDGTSEVLSDSDYEVSGALNIGTSTLTVSYSTKTAEIEVTVTGYAHSLASGTHTFTTQTAAKYATVSNGNHIKIGFPNVSSGNNAGAFINLSDLAKNLTTAQQNTNNAAINNLSDVYFTIPNGAVVKWEIKNISLPIADMLNNVGELNIGMRKTSASTGVIDPVGYPAHAERLTVEKTFTEATNVSCVFLYALYTKAVDVEFDLYLTVNGERWI